MRISSMIGKMNVLDEDLESGDGVLGALSGGSESEGSYRLERVIREKAVGGVPSPWQLAANLLGKGSYWRALNPIGLYWRAFDTVTLDLGNGVQVSRTSFRLTQAVVRRFQEIRKEEGAAGE
ncbi:hypothetical protein [Streptomyces sp. NPDC059979]|uniref:hypothetical protein n=1 Tax=Streptomyces sp. NPDC059979 TaxID=3347021 RepID=UPI0036A39392